MISIPALISKPIWGTFIDRVEPKHLTALSAVITGCALALVVWAVSRRATGVAVSGFVLMGLGWGGLIPLQEVTWASYFGRRHIGAIRSAGLPFSLILSAFAPQLASLYYDQVGDYNGAFLAIAGSCFISSVLILFVHRPARTPLPV